ncbi:hypothetical protein Asulf_00951 [Archaeoglobus sulfaticallidus PM70-1]|uniref:Uncharacterized protein n=1 Tax=Archaeoglobus sulfaticallidus PM70-1 TaxID=387631 RepID=N0BL79_9EURY|nr:hypothetical protein [Archaeoglobus sulfaticallidus]AGK60955.1 hypothetical protein Asulf_00951 [Archaeoglobus sulfaticallidus PM70-1]
MRGIQIKRVEKKIKERIEKIETIRVLEVSVLAQKDVGDLTRFMQDAKVLEDIIAQNIELRGKYLDLQAKVTFMADKIAAEKWKRILKLSKEVINESES